MQKPIAPLTVPTNSLHFPNFIATGEPLLQPSLIFPLPATFISPNIPLCATIPPISTNAVTALGVVQYLTASELFIV